MRRRSNFLPAAGMARAVARSSRAAALPRWVLPQLTQLDAAVPDGDQWLHEIKFDGYRLHARLDHGTVKLLTRTGLDWTHKYPAIAEAVSGSNKERVRACVPQARELGSGWQVRSGLFAGGRWIRTSGSAQARMYYPGYQTPSRSQ